MLTFVSAAGLWLVSYIKHKTAFVCMAGATTFYFSSSKDKKGSADVLKGLEWTYKHHQGSLIFSSLIHTAFSILRNILRVLLAGGSSSSNPISLCVESCCQCCLSCVEDLLEYVNSIALAYMAISGESYCKSAYNAFILNFKHLLNFYFALSLTQLFLVMSYTVVSAVASLCMY